jgi:hypothetical protein
MPHVRAMAHDLCELRNARRLLAVHEGWGELSSQSVRRPRPCKETSQFVSDTMARFSMTATSGKLGRIMACIVEGRAPSLLRN